MSCGQLVRFAHSQRIRLLTNLNRHGLGRRSPGVLKVDRQLAPTRHRIAGGRFPLRPVAISAIRDLSEYDFFHNSPHMDRFREALPAREQHQPKSVGFVSLLIRLKANSDDREWELTPADCSNIQSVYLTICLLYTSDAAD